MPFVHVGLPKTGSTAMQTVWFKSPEVALCYQNSAREIIAISKSIIDYGVNQRPLTQLKPDRTSSKPILISHENFSSPLLNQTPFQNRIPQVLEAFKELLTSQDLDHSNLLIVVRDPIKWIKSVYKQAVRQGYHNSIQGFITEQELYIKESLNLKRYLEMMRPKFSNILVLPYELFKKDPKQFWKIVSSTFNCTEFESKATDKVHETLTDERTKLLASLNKIMSQLHQMMKSHSHPQVTQVSQSLQVSRQWATRLAIENGSDDEVRDLASLLNLDNSVNTDNVALTDELRAYIAEAYLKPLFDMGHLETYFKNYSTVDNGESALS